MTDLEKLKSAYDAAYADYTAYDAAYAAAAAYDAELKKTKGQTK